MNPEDGKIPYTGSTDLLLKENQKIILISSEIHMIKRYCATKDSCSTDSIHPERKLWSAVLLQAVKDYQKDPLLISHSPTQIRTKREADIAGYWLFQSKEKGIGSLHWICEVLELSAERTRNAIKRGS